MKNNLIFFIKRKNESIHTTETIYIASIFSIIGGFVDSYTYITRDSVFAYAQTGNIIFFAMNIARRDFFEAMHYLISIFVFIIGIWFALYVKKILNRKKLMELEYLVILINSIILFVVGLLPRGMFDTVVISFIAFMSAILMITFNRVEGLAYVTNMCTGNLRSASENFFKFLFNKDKTGLKNGLIYLSILSCFMCGAFLGSLFTNILGSRSIWIASGLLLIVESLMFFDN
ncbi:YoaK family protein [uncultured Brachyspira sp.]|uniref:YoaK family protein n=1 Tax=uncultured Brachyspira sp. TaxID=221953 RepID=UPI00259AA7E8|nr:YoaK family protein [uncultured Brachyspira sp.]